MELENMKLNEASQKENNTFCIIQKQNTRNQITYNDDQPYDIDYKANIIKPGEVRVVLRRLKLHKEHGGGFREPW